MKKIFGLLLFTLLLSSQTVLAQNNNLLKGEILRERIQEKVASTTNKIMEKVKNRFQNMANRYEEAIKKEESIINKLTSRIEKIKNLGKDTTEAEKLLETAKTHLNEAKTAYEGLKTTAINADSVEKISKESLSSLKTATKTVEKHLKNTHQSLQKIIGVLRGVSQIKNATSTSSN